MGKCMNIFMFGWVTVRMNGPMIKYETLSVHLVMSLRVSSS